MKRFVTANDLAVMLGVNVKTLPLQYKEQLELLKIEYKILEGEEREKAILDQLKRIKEDTQIVGVDERISVWEKGWKENLNEFIDSGYNLDKLRPKYYRENVPCRFQGNFVLPKKVGFEYLVQTFLKDYIYRYYLHDVENIYEFGCGTGYNLVDIAKMYPEKNLVGLDFVPSVIELIEQIKNNYNFLIEGKIFDIRKPNQQLKIKENSAICTFASLEQVGSQYHKFVEFIIENKPKVCIHIEPIEELYDENNILDWLAKEFHTKRHYLSGYLTYLQEMEKAGKIEIIKVKRLGLGNFNHEGYNLVVWKVL